MARKKTLQRIINRSYKTIKHANEKQLRKDYQYLKKIVSSRVKTFKKHGAYNKVPDMAKNLPSSRNMTKQQLSESISKISGWLRGKVSTYKGYKVLLGDARRSFEKNIGYKFKNDEEYENFKMALNNFAERFKDIWKQISDIIVDNMVQGMESGFGIDEMESILNWLLDKNKSGLYNFEELKKSKENMVFEMFTEGGEEDFFMDKAYINGMKLGRLKKWLDLINLK